MKIEMTMRGMVIAHSRISQEDNRFLKKLRIKFTLLQSNLPPFLDPIPGGELQEKSQQIQSIYFRRIAIQ
jgi:hypothetical protein